MEELGETTITPGFREQMEAEVLLKYRSLGEGPVEVKPRALQRAPCLEALELGGGTA